MNHAEASLPEDEISVIPPDFIAGSQTTQPQLDPSGVSHWDLCELQPQGRPGKPWTFRLVLEPTRLSQKHPKAPMATSNVSLCQFRTDSLCQFKTGSLVFSQAKIENFMAVHLLSSQNWEGR